MLLPFCASTMNKDVEQGETEDREHVNGERNEEEEEETVVPFPDTIVDPRAMMIEFLDDEKWRQALIIIAQKKGAWLDDNNSHHLVTRFPSMEVSIVGQ